MKKHILIGFLVGIPATILYLFILGGDDIFDTYFWLHIFPPSVIIGLLAGWLGGTLDKKYLTKVDKPLFSTILTPVIAIVFAVLFSKILVILFLGIFWPGF